MEMMMQQQLSNRFNLFMVISTCFFVIYIFHQSDGNNIQSRQSRLLQSTIIDHDNIGTTNQTETTTIFKNTDEIITYANTDDINHYHTPRRLLSNDNNIDDPLSSLDATKLTMNQMILTGETLARPYPTVSWTWCLPHPTKMADVGTKDTNIGFLYVKTPKAASSTLAGLAVRIAKHQGERKHGSSTYCRAQYNHHLYNPYADRDRNASFLWSSVRHPEKRAISRVFFSFLRRNDDDPTDEEVRNALQISRNQYGVVSRGHGGFQLSYLSTVPVDDDSFWTRDRPTSVSDPARLERVVKKVVDDYDFIAVVERMDESLVALQLLLDLDPRDILYTSSKVSGANYFFKRWKGTRSCEPIKKSFVSPAVKEYLSSPEWFAKNYGEYLLYAAANKSLDLTIEKLGRERFEKALDDHLKLKAMVQEKCDAVAVYPCSADGVPQLSLSRKDCYWDDTGCGYRCIDDLVY